MTDKQLELILGIFAGYQVALVHLAGLMELKGLSTRADIAATFRATAQSLPQEADNRELIAMVLLQLAEGLETSATDHGFDEEIRRLLN